MLKRPPPLPPPLPPPPLPPPRRPTFKMIWPGCLLRFYPTADVRPTFKYRVLAPVAVCCTRNNVTSDFDQRVYIRTPAEETFNSPLVRRCTASTRPRVDRHRVSPATGGSRDRDYCWSFPFSAPMTYTPCVRK